MGVALNDDYIKKMDNSLQHPSVFEFRATMELYKMIVVVFDYKVTAKYHEIVKMNGTYREGVDIATGNESMFLL